MGKRKIRLGVNIDHAATLRQVRGGETPYPNLLKLAEIVASTGCEQITIHLREDRRHIQDKDVTDLCEARPCEINLEMAATPAMLKIALKNNPDWVCFVPEKRQELTTEGGLDVKRLKSQLKKMTEKLHQKGIEVSMFIDPSLLQVQASYDAGADAVEFHTGAWVNLSGLAKKREWKRLQEAAAAAHQLGLRVHAGHGLNLDSMSQIQKLPFLRELNIGHSIICYSLEWGLKDTLKKFLKLMK